MLQNKDVILCAVAVGWNETSTTSKGSSQINRYQRDEIENQHSQKPSIGTDARLAGDVASLDIHYHTPGLDSHLNSSCCGDSESHLPPSKGKKNIEFGK